MNRPLRPLAPTVQSRTFFIMTYLISWIIWVPLVLSRFQIGSMRIPSGTVTLLSFLGVLAPGIAAVILSVRVRSIGHLLGPLRIWNAGWKWWFAAVLVWPAILVITALVYNLLWHNPRIVATSTSISTFAVSSVFLLVATLGEEVGWRGLALPRLEQNHSALRASTILGLGWAIWHVPYWLLQDTYTQFGIAYLLLSLLFVFAGTYYITWFYNHGSFSLVLPVAFHISFNIVNVAWLPVTSNVGAFAILVILICIAVVLLIRRLEPAKTEVR